MKRGFKKSSIENLLKRADESDIIYLGDFHTFDQSSRNLERIIKHFTKKRKRISLCLEMIDFKNQAHIDNFINSHITEQEFLNSVDYTESWRFPWHHYRPFFLLAKKLKNFSIYGINTKDTLSKRDRFAANKISNLFFQKKKSKIIVLYGELHIFPNKIPQKVKKFIPDAKQMIVHQNLEEIYWKVHKKTNFKTEVISFNQDEYCILSSPPWIKYESLNYWFENLHEDPEFDLNEIVLESYRKLNTTIEETFISICNEIVSLLKLKKDIDKSKILDFNLIDQDQLNIIFNKFKLINSKSLINYYLKLIEHNYLFKLTGSNILFCSHFSVNRLVYLAGIHLSHQLSSSNKYNKNSNSTRFYTVFKELFFGYFCSKLINPHRKCSMIADFRSQIKMKNCEFKEEKRAVLNIYRSPKKFETFIEKKSRFKLHVIARFCAHFCSDAIFDHNVKNIMNTFNLILENFLLEKSPDKGINFIISQIKTIPNISKKKKRFF